MKKHYDPSHWVIRDYEEFLLQERGLGPPTVNQYLCPVRRFLAYRFGNRRIQLKTIRPHDVTGFVLHDSSERGRASLQTATTAIRSFLGFLFQRSQTVVNMTTVVPAVAGWRESELPRFLEKAQVKRLLRNCDRRRKIGKPDFAILLLMARLGLRAGEVARLSLEQIKWKTAELEICGKGAQVDRLPLLQDVGAAIADYLQKARPNCSCRHVFLRANRPFQEVAGPSAISLIVRRTLKRAGLNPPHQGAHLFRHSLATWMLRDGASLSEIGQVLRHRLNKTTEVYAKVDLAALRALAQSWPGGAR